MQFTVLHFEERMFYTLLIDAIVLTGSSRDHEIDYGKRMLARSSIVTSAMLLECCANLCSAGLSHSGNKTTLQKFREAALNTYQKQLDTREQDVAAADELRKIRNKYVHSWAQQHPVEPATDTPHGIGEVHPETWPLARISRSPSLWSTEDAIAVLRIARNFLHYYFIRLLQLTPDTIFTMLATSVKLSSGDTGPIAESALEHHLRFAAHELSVDFSFLTSTSAA